MTFNYAVSILSIVGIVVGILLSIVSLARVVYQSRVWKPAKEELNVFLKDTEQLIPNIAQFAKHFPEAIMSEKLGLLVWFFSLFTYGILLISAKPIFYIFYGLLYHLLIYFFAVYKTSKSSSSFFDFIADWRRPPIQMGGVPLSVLIVAVLITVFSRLEGNSIGTAAIYNGPLEIGALVFLFIFVAPIAEETFYRRYLQKTLAEREIKIFGAVLLTSIMFTVMHIPRFVLARNASLTFVTPMLPNIPSQVELMLMFLGVFGLSIALGWIYFKTNNLLTVVIGHALWNATLFIH